ncbi:MAG: hypothetical protein MUE42_08500 [Opitutaceae bacterium]|jgi:hypothetical protein|nr:hypothetical protein [Opitutaceae bacterium]
MKSKLALAAACAALAYAPGVHAAALDILFVANTDNTAYKTFATSGAFTGSTWTHVASGTTGATVGGDLDRLAFSGGTVSVKSYLESFDLVIVGLNVSSANFIDQASGADWAGLNVPILFNAALAARSFTTSDTVANRRVGLTSGDNTLTSFTFSTANETTRVSNSALSDRLFAGTTAPNNLYSATQTDSINATATYGTGEQIATATNGTLTAHTLLYWNAGTTDSYGRTLVADRALFSLKATGLTDLSADGQIVLGNLMTELTAIPEPSAFAVLAGFSVLGFSATRRRRVSR